MNYGDVLFGMWLGFVLACAWYDLVWWTNRT
jgi:hypothetical protein